MKDNITKWYDRGTKCVMIPSMNLMPNWISRMLEDCEEEANNHEAWPLKLLEKEARAAVWGLCAVLGVESHGVPGQACRLIERYLAAQMQVYFRVSMGSDEWTALKRSLSMRLPLLMVSCIQLAAKMNCADMDISANFVRACMGCKGVIFTVQEINNSEFQVFSMLGFRVPLWTSVEAGEALAVDAGLPHAMLEGVALFVNMAEYCRDQLDRRVRWAANLEPSCSKFKRATLRTLHLVAGSVAACTRYLSFSGPDPAPRLANLTRAPLCYIRCISDIILRNMLTNDMDNGLSQKRSNSIFLDVIGSNSPCKRKKD